MKNNETSTATQTAAVAEQGAHVAPEKAPSKKGASQKQGAPKGQKAAKGGKTKAAAPKKGAKAGKPAPAKKTSAPRAESKGAKILAMIGRAKGATLAEIMAYASHCTSLGCCEVFSLTEPILDSLTPLPTRGGLGPGSS